MSGLELAGKVAVGKVTSYLKTLMDPEKRRLLEEQTMEHLLEELPRMHRLIEERCADLEDRGCTHVEANIIANQVIEAQKRTLDEDKRRRLTNVLVNGLAADAWDKRTHRLMVRLTIELEEEHIEKLRLHLDAAERFVSFREKTERQAAEEARWPVEDEQERHRRRGLHEAVGDALDRELVTAGLLNEWRTTGGHHTTLGQQQTVVDVTLRITNLGRLFLQYLREPEGESSVP